MIEKLIPALRKACEYQKTEFLSSAVAFRTKAHKLDFTSQVDEESQRMLVGAVDCYFPKSGRIAEECGSDKDSEDGTWFIIDPLDGTANYKAGIALWSISIGMIRDDQIAEGLLAFPFTGEILCSTDMDRPKNTAGCLAEATFYGIDSAFEKTSLSNLKLQRRELGAAVPTLFLCCASNSQGHPRLDFALMGRSSFWDICGVMAFLKEIGGALITVEGYNLTSSTDLSGQLGEIKGLRERKFVYVASANAALANEIHNAGFLEVRSSI